MEKLSELLDLDGIPSTIEAIDISNFGDEHITAGIIALEDGKLCKKNYRTYKIRTTNGQDDYGAMREALSRRFAHRDEQPLPDLLLLDGGKGHVNVVKELLAEEGITLPVFGMVKDDYHKTRALTDGEGEISIAREQAVFVMIYKIQEEVHRFTIGRMKNAKGKEMKRSSLEDVKGIGPKKAQLLLKQMGTLTAIKKATVAELSALDGISGADAEAIRAHFDEKLNNKK